jgi:hypothetical protein
MKHPIHPSETDREVGFGELFAPLKAGPREGFALRVMARLDREAAPEAGFVWTWPKLAVPVAGALAAVVLFFAAFQIPDPTWLDSEKRLATLENSQWADGSAAQVASLPVFDHE